MKGPESPQQFNPENQRKKTEQPVSVQQAEATGFSDWKIEEVLGSKERVFAFLELKLKEYSGQLKQEDFDRLLGFELQLQLKDNPPIKGVFSPEDDLAKIRGLPKEQKREALATFKENLAKQRKALADCRVFIERMIEFDRDAPREKLIGLVEQFSAQYGFDNRQRQIIELLIDGYYKNRQRVLEVRQKFTDNHALVNELTGVNLGKDVKLDVSVGPMTIDIEVDGFNAGRIYERRIKPTIVFKYNGFASQSIGENSVYYIVINQDRCINKEKKEGVRRHEYEHQKNRLLREVFRAVEDQENSRRPWEALWSFWDYKKEQDPETRKVILEYLFKASRAAALESARDEIIASLHNGHLSILQEKQLASFFFRGEGAYDYLGSLRNWEEFEDDSFYQETMLRMLVREYREIIQKAVNSYAELVEKGKYSIREAIALLTDRSLEDWPRTIRRLLEQKRDKIIDF